MAEMRNVCNYNGLVVQLSEKEWYELNLLFCNGGRYGSDSYTNLDSVLRAVFDVGIQVLKEELETHQTLASLTRSVHDGNSADLMN